MQITERRAQTSDLPNQFTDVRCTGNRRDVRGSILGIQEAAKVIGYGRTQMWRDARDGMLPCIVEGTAQRPVYRFIHEDLVAYRRRREEQKELAQMEREWKARLRRQTPAERKRMLHAMEVISGGIDLLCLAPLLRRQRRR